MTVGRWLVSVLAVTMADCGSHGSDSGSCNTLVDDGPPIEYRTGPAPAPTAMGGTPAAGSYALSALIKYTTATATYVPQGTYSEVLQIEGNTIRSAGTASGTFARNTSTFTISGTTISSVDTCPAHDAWIHDFTATATELQFYNGNTIDTVEEVYTKR